MTFDEFHNALRILLSIDQHELVEVGIEIDDAEWIKFRDDPLRYFVKAHDDAATRIWSIIGKRQNKPKTNEVTPEFREASERAAIRALRGLEQTAIMLETYAPEVFPEINEQGQKHFGRVMMESAAQAIRDSWSQAIREVENVG
jgi:hypothetical protein